MDSVKAVAMKIGTHCGVFHADETLACYMLKLLPLYKNAEILRTRDDKLLEKCDIVVDVGASINPPPNDLTIIKGILHLPVGTNWNSAEYFYGNIDSIISRGFVETASTVIPGKPWTIKLSSAGLIFCHFGKEIIQQLAPVPLHEDVLEAIFNYTYENLIQEIDAIDNGEPICDGEPRYDINTSLSSRVKNLNAAWNEPQDDNDQMNRFEKAVALVGTEFVNLVHYAINSWYPARKIVIDAINNRFKVHESGKIILLPKFCPWREHYFSIAKEMKLDPSSMNFVLFSDGEGKHRVQGIPISSKSFEGKIFLHPKWRGLRDEELSKVSGIPGCVFVHATGFIGGNTTQAGALEMAVKSLVAE